MILDIKTEPVSEKRLKQAPINTVVAVIFALQCKNLLNEFNSPISNVNWGNVKSTSSDLLQYSCEPSYTFCPSILDYTTQIYSLGSILYTAYAWELILASLILLSAMLGSIALTLSRSTNAKGQHIYEQNIRDFKLTVKNYR